MKKLLTISAMLLSVAAWCQGQFQNELVGSLTYTSDKVMQLAKVAPADKYEWAPAEGVRSLGDVVAHIISANYFFASKLGAAIPETVNLQTIEQDLKTKEALTAALKDSYQLVISTVKGVSDESLSDKVEFPFPGEFTSMSTALIILSHTNEHLGQLIAYCRSNGITPPWSENEGN